VVNFSGTTIVIIILAIVAAIFFWGYSQGSTPADSSLSTQAGDFGYLFLGAGALAAGVLSVAIL